MFLRIKRNKIDKNMVFCFGGFWLLMVIEDSAINEYLETIFCATPCFQMG